jgi:hypothetical protein
MEFSMPLRPTLLLGTFALIAACAGGPAELVSASADLPDEPPAIVGIITAIEDGRVRIEAGPDVACCNDKAIVRLTSSTRIVGPDGAPWPPESLRVGQRVQAWYSGPIAESYPLQTDAAALAIQ